MIEVTMLKRVIEIDAELETWCRPIEEGARAKVVTTAPNGHTVTLHYVAARNSAGELEWVRIPGDPSRNRRALERALRTV